MKLFFLCILVCLPSRLYAQSLEFEMGGGLSNLNTALEKATIEDSQDHGGNPAVQMSRRPQSVYPLSAKLCFRSAGNKFISVEHSLRQDHRVIANDQSYDSRHFREAIGLALSSTYLDFQNEWSSVSGGFTKKKGFFIFDTGFRYQAGQTSGWLEDFYTTGMSPDIERRRATSKYHGWGLVSTTSYSTQTWYARLQIGYDPLLFGINQIQSKDLHMYGWYDPELDSRSKVNHTGQFVFSSMQTASTLEMKEAFFQGGMFFNSMLGMNATLGWQRWLERPRPIEFYYYSKSVEPEGFPSEDSQATNKTLQEKARQDARAEIFSDLWIYTRPRHSDYAHFSLALLIRYDFNQNKSK